MDAPYTPIPPHLLTQVHTLTRDLHRARENLAAGRLRPEHLAALERVLTARMELLEAEVHQRLLDEARRGGGRADALAKRLFT